MEELELVLKVLESSPNGIETLSFANSRLVIAVAVGVVYRSEILDEDETTTTGGVNGGGVSGGGGGGDVSVVRRILESFDGGEEVRP